LFRSLSPVYMFYNEPFLFYSVCLRTKGDWNMLLECVLAY